MFIFRHTDVIIEWPIENYMPTRWTIKEENILRRELKELYVSQNKTIKEISGVLNLAPQTVFQRLGRLGIKTQKHLKAKYLNKRNDIVIPKKYTSDIAEFVGIMLGDGKLSRFQTMVTLGNKEESYANFVAFLIKKIFLANPKILTIKNRYSVVYIGSVAVTELLEKQGLVFNKVKSQVKVPKWIFKKQSFIKAFIRGFFDTDGSIYQLRYGTQISFSNRSLPILLSLQSMLLRLKYKPSEISSFKVYLTRKRDIRRFSQEIGSNNPSKAIRLAKCVGTQVDNEGGL